MSNATQTLVKNSKKDTLDEALDGSAAVSVDVDMAIPANVKAVKKLTKVEIQTLYEGMIAEVAPVADWEKLSLAEKKDAVSAALATHVWKAEQAALSAVSGVDALSDIAYEVTNIQDEEKAYSMLSDLANSTARNEFMIGGILSTINTKNWFKGHKNFREFMTNETDINYRKGVYLTGIFTSLVSAGIPWDKVKSLGWSKLKEIAHLLTLENVDQWVETAKAMNTDTLKQYLVKKSADNSGTASMDDISSGAMKKLISRTFKVFEDQVEIINAAVDKAKSASGTSSDGQALERICEDFLGSATKSTKTPAKAAPASVKDVLAALILKHQGDEAKAIAELFEDFQTLYPNADVNIDMN